MLKFIIQRLLIIPALLLLVNFLGFAYAHYARPIRASTTPYVQAEEAGPLIPEYVHYLETLANLDFGLEIATPDTSRSTTPVTLGETLAKATIASLGLLAISLTISIILGLYLGFKATKNEPAGVSRWLTILSTVGLAMPSFYIGSLLIIGLIFYILWRGPETNIPLPLSGFGTPGIGFNGKTNFPAGAGYRRSAIRRVRQAVCNCRTQYGSNLAIYPAPFCIKKCVGTCNIDCRWITKVPGR